MLIDTHCHLDFKDFDTDRDTVIERAIEAGVGRIINVASSMEGSRRSVELAGKHDIIYASVGVHPHEAGSVTDKVIDDLRILAKKGKVVAIGEVGLDYYRNLSPKTEQIKAFRKFIQLAQESGLPLIIHSREADNEIIDILEECEGRGKREEGRPRGVVHCFSGDKEFLKRFLKLGLFVSFTANLTFKNAKNLREVAKDVPVERLLLETDAPFLAPQELRGKRNESSYLIYLVRAWAQLLALSEEDIMRITTHNANGLFKLNIDEPSKIAYPIRDSLYLNVTNRCTNDCDFCVRNLTPFVKGHNLKLDSEPSEEELLKAIGDPAKYKEIVFCGYGEPTLRFDLIKAVAKKIRESGVKVRLVTNGHGSLINSRAIAKELAGVIDRVSVSLNADTNDRYAKLCSPKFGPSAYQAVMDFIKDCVKNGIDAEVTCLDLPHVDVKKCEEIAESLGARFRLRKAGAVG